MNTPTPTHPELLSDILAFCAKRGMPKSVFGREAVRDASLIPDLIGGRELRRATIAKVRAFMDAA